MIKNINKANVQEVQVQALPKGYVMGEKNKLIKVGGKKYNELLKAGVVEQQEAPPVVKPINKKKKAYPIPNTD